MPDEAVVLYEFPCSPGCGLTLADGTQELTTQSTAWALIAAAGIDVGMNVVESEVSSFMRCRQLRSRVDACVANIGYWPTHDALRQRGGQVRPSLLLT